MKTAFFGQFLMDKVLVNAQQLEEAVELQKWVNMKIGQLVLEKKLLTPEQIRAILDFQKKNDFYFGEAAQKLGLLTSEQVSMLLKEQEERHIYIGESLVKLGYLTKEQLEKELAEFEIEQQENTMLSPACFLEAFKDEKPFIEQFVIYTIKILRRIGGLIAKYDDYAVIEGEIPLEPVSIEVHFEGELSNCLRRYLLTATNEMANFIATNFYEGGLLQVDNVLIEDAMSELVNIVCAQSCSRLKEYGELKVAQSKKIITNEAQQQSKYVLNNNEKAAFVSLITPYGRTVGFLLVFSTKVDQN